jgi:hypothetical protein
VSTLRLRSSAASNPSTLSSAPHFGFSFQLALRQCVVECLPPEKIGFVRAILEFGFVFPPAGRSRSKRQEAIGRRGSASIRCKKACPIRRRPENHRNMSPGVKRGVGMMRRLEARSYVRPSPGSGQHQRRLAFCLRRAHTIPLLDMISTFAKKVA